MRSPNCSFLQDHIPGIRLKPALCRIMKEHLSILHSTQLGITHLASLPALFQANGANILITESDIEDYPGMWLRGAESGKISGTWPKYPESEKLNERPRSFCYQYQRLYCKNNRDKNIPMESICDSSRTMSGLIESDLVFKLAAPNKIERYKMDQTRTGSMGLVECK